MPFWHEIVEQVLNFPDSTGPESCDMWRRVYLARLHAHTNRDTIVYAMSDASQIMFEDIHGVMSVMGEMKGKKLDIILHSGGGEGEAAKAIIDYLRQKYDHIRVIVPLMAMSAATMLACGADELVLGKHSFLGPIDPQLVVKTSWGHRWVSARDILNQFEMAKKDLKAKNPKEAWEAMLQTYGPEMLAKCESAKSLSEDIVKNLLCDYMFKKNDDGTDNPEGPKTAKQIAGWLADHDNFFSHNRYLSRPELESKGLKITYLETDKILQDNVLSVFHLLKLLFQLAGVEKIIENHLCETYVDVGGSLPLTYKSPQLADLLNDLATGKFTPASLGIESPTPGLEQPPDNATGGSDKLPSCENVEAEATDGEKEQK